VRSLGRHLEAGKVKNTFPSLSQLTSKGIRDEPKIF